MLPLGDYWTMKCHNGGKVAKTTQESTVSNTSKMRLTD